MRKTECNLCGSTYYRIIYDISGTDVDSACDTDEYKITEHSEVSKSLRIVRCLKCGLAYVNPQKSLINLFRSYRDMKDESYITEERGRRLSAKLILKKISKYKKSGRILDVGCAAGFLLAEARNQGWEVHGVELSKWAVELARQKFNIDVFEGLLKDAKFPLNYFDAIVMIDTLEHLPDPKMTLAELRGILKPNGILCISTPDMESFLSKLLQARWWGVKKSHLFYFSKRTLAKMLDTVGFKIVKYSPHVRIFSFAYLTVCLKNYNTFLYRLFNMAAQLPILSNRLLKLNFKDQIEVFVQKKHCLTFIDQDEKGPRLVTKKMKTVAVLPAYNAAKTLEVTLRDIPKDLVDDIILVDDASKDNTVALAKRLGLKVYVHHKNKGYGANQKTCYGKALEMGAEIAVMVHPDYQYDPKVIPQLIEPIQKGCADAVFGSRMMKGGALEGGMPIWKHSANILLTALENVILGTYLTEYHSGFRAYSARYLKTVNFMLNSDGFIFDTEIIIQGLLKNMRIEEVPIKTRYFDEASTIKFLPSVIYGLAILKTLLKYILHTKRIVHFRQFD